MTTPSPFEIGRAVGTNISGAFSRQRENRAIDEVLSQPYETPEQFTNAMSQILQQVSPENRKEALGILQEKYKQKRLSDLTQRRQQRLMGRPQEMVQDEMISTPQGTFEEASVMDYTPEERLMLQQIDPEQYKALEKQQELSEKSRLAERKYAQEETKPLREEIRTIRKELPNTEIALSMAEDAIEGAQPWEGVAEFLSQVSGLESLRTRKGAELQSAIKQYFLGDLSSIKGGRPNQLIEKQLLDAYPKMGRDAISNRKILLGLQAKEAIAKAKEREYAKLEEKYLSQNKPLPANAEYLINKKLEPVAERIQNRTLKAMQSLNNIQTRTYKKLKKGLKSNESLMVDENGEFFAVEKKEVDKYKNQGWQRI